MQAIVDFLSGIGNAIVSIFDFVIALFRDFITFLKLLTLVPSYLESFLSWIPSEFTVLLLLLFSVVILYKILGRDG